MKLENKVAIVTGGAEGIGKAVALCLAYEGANVVVADIKADVAAETAREIEGMGRKALVAKADLTDSNQVVQVVKNTIDTFGKIDILVNNVGGSSKELLDRLARGASAFTEQTDTEWDRPKKGQIIRQLLPYLYEKAYVFAFPAINSYNFWQPWVKEYSGESFAGYRTSADWHKYIWIDQDMRYEMTGRR